jgi:hypothetical protein
MFYQRRNRRAALRGKHGGLMGMRRKWAGAEFSGSIMHRERALLSLFGMIAGIISSTGVGISFSRPS